SQHLCRQLERAANNDTLSRIQSCSDLQKVAEGPSHVYASGLEAASHLDKYKIMPVALDHRFCRQENRKAWVIDLNQEISVHVRLQLQIRIGNLGPHGKRVRVRIYTIADKAQRTLELLVRVSRQMRRYFLSHFYSRHIVFIYLRCRPNPTEIGYS